MCSEKPLIVTMEGCREMIEVAERNNVLLQVDFHKRFDEYHVAMKQKIDAGDLGEIEHGYAHMATASRCRAIGGRGRRRRVRPPGSWASTFTTLARFLMNGATYAGVATGGRKAQSLA